MDNNNKQSKKGFKRQAWWLTVVLTVSTNVIGLSTARAETLTLSEEALDCILEPNKNIDVSSPVEGVVDEVMVERGSYIKKGAPVLTLRSELEAATVNLAKARAEFGSRTVERNDKLQDLISDHEKDEIATDAQIAQLELQEAKVRLAMKTIYSPISGLVIETLKEEGEFVSADPIMTIVSINPLHAEVIAPVSYLGKVQKKQKAKVGLESGPFKGEYQASVKTVDPVVDPASGTFRIQLTLPNPRNKIPSGLKCQVRF